MVGRVRFFKALRSQTGYARCVSCVRMPLKSRLLVAHEGGAGRGGLDPSGAGVHTARGFCRRSGDGTTVEDLWDYLFQPIEHIARCFGF
jgi:hypothetical protein